MLALEDLKGFTEEEVKKHISEQYSGEREYDYGSDTDIEALREELEDYDILVAYESVGNWGCDSTSYFLMRKANKFMEFMGSHCSCYGFEGQYDPQEATLEYLQSDKFWVCTGGYDDNADDNENAIKEYMRGLFYETT